MLPPDELLPAVLPTERIGPTAKAVRDVRDELRRIPNARHAVAVVGCWVQSFAPIVIAAWIGQWWAWLLAFCFMGRAFALFSSLAHEAAHRTLFSNRKVNDFVGRWIVGAPGFVPTDLYRRGHMAHHKDEFGPNEPDMNLYVGYPVSRASLRRKLTRDAVGISGWKNLKGLFRGLKYPQFRPFSIGILGAQVVLMIGFALAGYWWAYWLMWFVPYMTQWRVINRLRAIAEHGGMERSDDRRRTTHSVRQQVARAVLHGAIPHRLAPLAPRRHRHSLVQPAPLPSRAGGRRLDSRRAGVSVVLGAVAGACVGCGTERFGRRRSDCRNARS